MLSNTVYNQAKQEYPLGSIYLAGGILAVPLIIYNAKTQINTVSQMQTENFLQNIFFNCGLPSIIAAMSMIASFEFKELQARATIIKEYVDLRFAEHIAKTLTVTCAILMVSQVFQNIYKII